MNPKASERQRLQFRFLFLKGISILLFLILFVISFGQRVHSQDVKPLDLTPEERAWLDSNPDKLVLYFESHFPPIEYLSDDGYFVGLSADIVEHIEALLGVKFEKMHSNKWEDVLSALRDGDVALAPCMVGNPERQEFISFTAPYLTLPIAIITKTNGPEVSSLPHLQGKRVGVVKGYAIEDYLKNPVFDGLFTLVPFQNVVYALQGVSFGEVDVYVENLAVAAYYNDKLGISNLRVAGQADYYFEISIGVSKQYPLLFSAIQKALSAIPADELSKIQRKWVSFDSKPWLSEQTILVLKISGVFAVLLMLSLMGLSVVLKRKLNQRIIELKKSEERYRSIISVSNTGAWEFHADSKYLWCSPEYFEMLGYRNEDFKVNERVSIENAWINLIHPDDKELATNHFANYLFKGSDQMYQSYFRMKHKNGEWIWIWSRGKTLMNPNGTPSGITLGTHINITERKELEFQLLEHKQNLEQLIKERTDELQHSNKELQQTNIKLEAQRKELEVAIEELNKAQEQLIYSEKMASLGILSAGVAHEINNPINFIKNGALVIQQKLNENQETLARETKPFFDAIYTGVNRITEIVKSMGKLSLRETLSMEECNIDEVIGSCLTIVYNQHRDRIKLKRSLSTVPPVVAANESKMHQAFLNVLMNAVQAIKGEGEITISTKVEGSTLKAVISDNGMGIPEENMKRIFDPFFTTKEPGEGTGLGLSITNNILNLHRGTIQCNSVPNLGTTFTIQLPLKNSRHA